MAAPSRMTRRALLVAGAGASAAALAACSSPSTDGAASPNNSAPSATSALPPGTVVQKLADIPVGGTASAKVDGLTLLLAQPRAGKVEAYSAVCPHQGCVVAPAGAEFQCPCHGSRFEAATGAVISGPATRSLTPIAVTVSGDKVTVA